MMSQALLDWLLEADHPSARYFALRDLLDRPQEDPEVVAARSAVTRSAPVRAILDAQYPGGYWIKPDRGYSPKYKATIWQLIFLADQGATRIEPIARACEHLMRNAFRADHGLFSAHVHSSGVFPCLNGDLLRALWHFGYGDHPLVRTVLDALARRVVADGYLCVRNRSARTRAGLRDKTTWQPCVWGCVKVLRGFAAIPGAQRSPIVCQAIERGVAYLLSHDLAQDQRPALVDVPSHWHHFGFPLGYGSDLLEALLALAELVETGSVVGAGSQRCIPVPGQVLSAPVSGAFWAQIDRILRDILSAPRTGAWSNMKPAPKVRCTLSQPRGGARLEFAATDPQELYRIIVGKRDEQGRWPLEHALRNAWANFGREGEPNKWVTLRALKVLNALFHP